MSKRRNRFVVPTVVRKDLSDGDWIEIKKELAWGEQKDLEDSAVGTVAGIIPGSEDTSGVGVGLALGEYEITRLLTWIVEWSLVDTAGKSVPVTRDSIRALYTEDANEISGVITAYTEELKASKNAETPTDE